MSHTFYFVGSTYLSYPLLHPQQLAMRRSQRHTATKRSKTFYFSDQYKLILCYTATRLLIIHPLFSFLPFNSCSPPLPLKKKLMWTCISDYIPVYVYSIYGLCRLCHLTSLLSNHQKDFKEKMSYISTVNIF